MSRSMLEDFEDDGASFRVRRRHQLGQSERVIVIDNRFHPEKPPVPKIIKVVMVPVTLAGLAFLAALVVSIAVTVWEHVTG